MKHDRASKARSRRLNHEECKFGVTFECADMVWAAAILAVAIINHWSGSDGMIVVVLGGATGASITIVSNALRKK